MIDPQTKRRSWRSRRREWAHAFLRQWHWVLLTTLGFALAGFCSGYAAGFYTATVELLDRALSTDVATAVENKRPGPGATPTDDLVAALARSDFVRHRVVAATPGDANPAGLADLTTVSVTPGAGLIAIEVKGRNAHQAVRLANAFGEQVCTAARQWLENQHTGTLQQIQRDLTSIDEELERASQDLIAFQRRTAGTDFEGEATAPLRRLTELGRKRSEAQDQIAANDLQIQNLTRELFRLSPALVAAKESLNTALLRYTEEHPKVKELRATVASLEEYSVSLLEKDDPGIGLLNHPAAAGLYSRLTDLRSQRATLLPSLETLQAQMNVLQTQLTNLPADQAENVRLKSRFDALKQQRFNLARRFQDAQLFQSADVGRVRIVEAAQAQHLGRSHKWQLGLWSGLGGGLLGFLLAAPFFVIFVAGSGRIRSEADLLQVTGLPLLATLGNLSHLSDEERNQWAFRTFTRLRCRITQTNQEAVICGFTSEGPAEGRSTWIKLLGDAAGRLGYRVVCISAGAPDPAAAPPEHASALDPIFNSENETLPNVAGGAHAFPQKSEVTRLPASWAWSPEYRERWAMVVQEWQAVKHLAVFVELPPASAPETILLGESLPNMVWLGNRDTSQAAETRLQLNTLREARANLIGCVFNRTVLRRRKRRSRRASALWALLLMLASSAWAQPTNEPVPAPVPVPVARPAGNSLGAVTLSMPDQLANWQKRLTLGPGDVFDVIIYERPDSLRNGLTVGPDGRINYLEARDVMATGLTVDELRTKLEEVLGKFHRGPRVVINPIAYTSKKYYLLGHVNQKGVFPLDRPTSIVEAVARAKGFVTTYHQRNTWFQADLARSFLIRPGTDGTFVRVPIDFEGLFLHGDLQQNFALEPDDYVFFPPLDLQEVYVLGEVRGPGVQPYSPDLTALGAILARGGFTSRAFKTRVLIVRGSLERPQTFVLNTSDILKGQGLDFALRSRDIIYVHRKPWIKAQELLEAAIMDFVRAFAVAYAGEFIGPFIKEPLVK